MRIAELNDVAFVATELAGAMREQGHDVDLLHMRLVGADLPPAVKPLVAPARFYEWLQLARRIRSGNYDAVHIHYAYVGMIGVLARLPYILHCHGDDVRDLARPIRRPFIKRALHSAAHVYYATPDLEQHVRPLRPDAEFLPNPVDTCLFTPAPVDPAGPEVLIGCSLSANKGVENILAGVQRLVAELPDVRITALAAGEAIAEFDRIPNVTLIAHQPRWKLPALIARHRVVVGQVYQGAIGMAELEAMSCGRPLVANFAYDAAYAEPPPLLNAANGDDVAATILRVLDNPLEAQSTGERSRKWIERHHDRRAIAEKVLAQFGRAGAQQHRRR